MSWDYAEANTIAGPSGSFDSMIANTIAGLLSNDAIACFLGRAIQADASSSSPISDTVISTDPPYYDNIGYADLSDFFFVWLRRAIGVNFPALFSTLAVPKAEELVATPYRQGSREAAESFFLDGMETAMRRISRQALVESPVTIYYAFKQAEKRTESGQSNTGWETFLEGAIRSGLAITGTWPLRTERANRQVAMGTNALASSIVLVCRRRPSDPKPATWSEFRKALRRTLPPALIQFQKTGIAPVDLAQAAIGPGMAAYTSFAEVRRPSGERVGVGEALALINKTLEEILAGQEADLDSDTRWAVAWYETHGFGTAPFGEANTLATAKNTSVAGLVEAGILHARSGQVRLLRPEELPEDWNPATDRRLTVWEMVQHLVRVLEREGEIAAGKLLRRIGGQAGAARELAYRLYGVCERQKRAAEAFAYNSLVISWPELTRIAQEDRGKTQALF